MRPPSILFIICHDLGRRLGSYGRGLSTPQLDRLAQDGVRFENCFCTAAQCSPSRGSIMTGQSPHANGLMGLAHIGWEFHRGEKTLPTYLRECGYESHLFGVQHESADATSLGYDAVDVGPRRAKDAVDTAIRWLERRAGQSARSPFFLSLGFEEPHRPHPHDASEYDIDDPAQVAPLPYLPERPGIRQDIAGLNGLIHRVDVSVGRLLATLDETGLRQNTLVIFTTDHGIAMPRAKGMSYDPGLEVGLLLQLPGRFEGGKVCSEMLSNVDYLPTLVELAGGLAPDGVEGKSFLPLLDGRRYEPRDHIFCEMTWHDRYNPMRGIRTREFKYIRNFGERPLVYLPADIFVGSAGEEVREEFYARRRPPEELYDLRSDPLEMNNVVDSARYRDTLQELRRKVDTWMSQTEDPLLRGDVPPTEEQRKREVEDPLPNG